MSVVFLDTSENFHPYECDGPGKCEHCDRQVKEHHSPDKCALCDDGEPTDTKIYGAGGAGS